MSKIDTKDWGAFRIIDLFFVCNTHSILKASVVENSGNTPYVTAGNENNGVYSYIDYDKNQIEKGNAIMIGGKTQTVTYQEKDFFSNDSHNLILYLKNDTFRTKHIQLFLVAALKASFGGMYSWEDSISHRSIQKDTIYLPMDTEGNPDWSHMELYMQNLETNVSTALTRLRTLNGIDKSNCVSNNWANFTINSLFRVEKGTRLTKADMKDGPIRFIGASSMNNGITAYISNNEKIHPKNTITVSYNGSVGEAFYQDEQFWASDDVNVLYPKFELNFYRAMFIIPSIKAAGRKYAFIDKWKKEDMEKACILLPVDDEGNPNWGYMENYIKSNKASLDDSLKYLQLVLRDFH